MIDWRTKEVDVETMDQWRNQFCTSLPTLSFATMEELVISMRIHTKFYSVYGVIFNKCNDSKCCAQPQHQVRSFINHFEGDPCLNDGKCFCNYHVWKQLHNLSAQLQQITVRVVRKKSPPTCGKCHQVGHRCNQKICPLNATPTNGINTIDEEARIVVENVEADQGKVIRFDSNSY